MRQQEHIRLQMRGICKSFSGNKVLDFVDLELPRGKVLALLGENGAGKSTLIKILNGDYTKDHGDILIDGIKVEIHSPAEAAKLGIRVIYQELNYVKDTTVIENVLLGHLPKKYKWFVDRKQAEKKTKELLLMLGSQINPYELIANLSIADKQLVEIAKALSVDARILVMDEPTAALTNKETKQLFKVIQDLTKNGVSVIYISHRLEEINEIADLIMVMRDGKQVGYKRKEDFSLNEIVRLMVGREVTEKLSVGEHDFGHSVLKVNQFTKDGYFQNISFELHEGEILGLFGLLGAGSNEVTKSLFGAIQADGGEIQINGRSHRFSAPYQAKKEGIAYVPSDRKVSGLVLGMSVKNNLTLANLWKYSKLGFMSRQKETEIADKWVDKLKIKLSGGIHREIKFLSGGNQQKVILSRWLDTGARILVLNEPTMGVDIGSRSDIYQFLDQLRKQKMAILIASSDLVELEAVCDRIIVMRTGQIVSEILRSDLTKERLLAAAMGVK